MDDLEQRIAAALTDETITSDALADLFAETREALAAAAQAVEDTRKRALDPAGNRLHSKRLLPTGWTRRSGPRMTTFQAISALRDRYVD